jgi:alpha-beta hydrolase superfamily lysophospholipase
MQDLMGTDVLYRRWDASPGGASPKAVFLLVHGLGAHTARWDGLATDMARRGLASYAVELRGFGRTPDRPRGHVASLRVWERDTLSLRETIARDNPGRKIFVLGESVGGLVAFNAAARHPGIFAGVILISPDFKNGLKFPLSSYLTLAGLILFRPAKTIPIPYTSAMCTRDRVYQAEMDANPDELRVGSLRCLMSILGEQRAAKRLAKSFRDPALFLLSGHDLLVDARAARKIYAELAVADKALLEYPEMLHALSIDLGREEVFRTIGDWVETRA